MSLRPDALAPAFATSALPGLASAAFLPSAALSSPFLPAAFSSPSFSDDGCDALPRHSAPLATPGFFSIGRPPIAVASGAPVSPRPTSILKPGEVGPSWETTRPATGSAASAGPAATACRTAAATRDCRKRDDMEAPHGRCAPLRSAGATEN